MLVRHLARFGVGQVFHETPGEGGGGGAWPDYQVPAGVGEPAEPTAGEPPAGAQPASGQPAAGARERGEPEGQPGGQPGAGRQGGRSRELPDYRVDAIRERELRTEVDKLRADGERMRTGLAAALGLDGDRPRMDPRTVRLRDTMFQIMPELKELVEKLHPRAAELLGIADQAPLMSSAQESYWQGVAARAQTTLHDNVAKLLLGEGKTGKDLDDEAREDVRDLFIKWVERDQSGVRVRRYESQDPGLIDEFIRAWGARYLDPVRRSAAVAIGGRAQQTARFPQSGGSSMPRPAQPPKVDMTDEDAVHKRAWETMVALRGA